MAFRTAEEGFDPQRIDDRYSVGVCENLFEPLLTYDYLARPVRLVPLVAEAVPEPEEGGTRYTFRLKPGILFADDPAFKGQKRELVAKDVEYAIKRFRDPKNRSPYEWLFEHKLVGLDELSAQAAKTGRFDYDARMAGIEVRDRYTVSFKLVEPDFNFLYVLAMPNVVPVAREVIEAYDADTHAHPVGTGPYVLQGVGAALEDRAGEESQPPRLRARHALRRRVGRVGPARDRRLRGKRLPLIDRVEIYPIEDEQPRFLAFLNREHDLIDELPFAFIHQVLPNGKLAPALARQGVRVFREEAARVHLRRLQPERQGGRARQSRRGLHAGARGAASRDGPRPRPRPRDHDPAQGPGHRGAEPGAAGRGRLRPAVPRRSPRTTTRPAPRRSSTWWVTSTATATAGATSPTAGRCSSTTSTWPTARPAGSSRSCG